MSAPLLVPRPLALRDRVAAAIVAALADEAGKGGLARFAKTFTVPPDEIDAVERRLRAGHDAAEAYRHDATALDPDATALERALARAACLFRGGLFFEVHEVLEVVWHDLEDPGRGAVQGLIQIAVAMHHLGHENARGAASLFASGRAKLEGHRPSFIGMDVASLLDDLRAWEAAAAGGQWPRDRSLPTFAFSPARARPPSS